MPCQQHVTFRAVNLHLLLIFHDNNRHLIPTLLMNFDQRLPALQISHLLLRFHQIILHGRARRELLPLLLLLLV
jgi:hypothetical protein